MPFTIKFQQTTSANNQIGKDITDVLTLSGSLRNETSVIDPVIRIELDENDISEKNFFQCNYCTIERFNRKYFITDMQSLRNNLVEVHCHVDVLDTYKDEIKDLNAIIRRQENNWNLMLDDGCLLTYQDPIVILKRFPQSFTNESIILAVAGS